MDLGFEVLDLGSYLGTYDYTVVMAYAAMEGTWNSRTWYGELFNAAGGRAHAGKVIYKLQAFDWKKKSWISGQDLKRDLTFLLSIGANHVGELGLLGRQGPAQAHLFE